MSVLKPKGRNDWQYQTNSYKHCRLCPTDTRSRLINTVPANGRPSEQPATGPGTVRELTEVRADGGVGEGVLSFYAITSRKITNAMEDIADRTIRNCLVKLKDS